MSYGYDGDGGRVFDHRGNVAERLSEEWKLRSGAWKPQPLPENKKSILRFFINNPRSTMRACECSLDVTLNKNFYEMAEMGYLVGDGRWLNKCRISATAKGVEAFNRKRTENAAGESIPYDPYAPPKAEFVRAGGEDALRIKSKGPAA